MAKKNAPKKRRGAPFGARRTKPGKVYSLGAQRSWRKIEELDLSIPEAAEKVGIHRSTMNRLLYGDVLPGRDVGAEIERVLGVASGDWSAKPQGDATKLPTMARPRRAA